MNKIDWDTIHRSVAQLKDSLRQTGTLSAEEAAEVLRARAARLAMPQEPEDTASEPVEVMVMRIGGERYALETTVVHSVIVPGRIAPLPETAEHILGIVNDHGRLLLVVDGSRLIGLAPDPPQVTQSGSAKRLVVVGDAVPEFAILVHGTLDVETVDAATLAQAPPSLPEPVRRIVRGVTSHMTILLDTKSLMQDPRIWIDDPLE